MITSVPLALVLVVSALTSAIYGLSLVRAPASTWRSLIKTVPVASLAVATAMANGPAALVLALVFAALGDLALSREGERAFLSGLISFAAAHLALIWLLWPATVTFGVLQVWPVALGVGMAAMLWRGAGALRPAVMVYVAIIVTMVVIAFQPGQGVWVAGAAALFMASDSALGVSVFRLGDDHPAQAPLAPFIWFTYWAAQLAFVIGLVLIPSS